MEDGLKTVLHDFVYILGQNCLLMLWLATCLFLCRCGHTLTAIAGPDGDLSSAKLVLFGEPGPWLLKLVTHSLSAGGLDTCLC